MRDDLTACLIAVAVVTVLALLGFAACGIDLGGSVQ